MMARPLFMVLFAADGSSIETGEEGLDLLLPSAGDLRWKAFRLLPILAEEA
jgi:hypothetical protein